MLKTSTNKASATTAVKKDHDMTSNGKEQVKLTAKKKLKKVFHKDVKHMSNLVSTPTKILVTTGEIKLATRKLKNNKSPGKNKISAELIKFVPDIVY